MSTTPRDLVAAFDGSHLFHAYGPATDTAEIGGLFGSAEARGKATTYLYSAILHQGTPWIATAPVVDLLLDCLPLPGARDARLDILQFVTDVAEVRVSDDPAESLDTARAALAAQIADLGPEPAAAWAALAAEGSEEAYEDAFDDEDVANLIYLRTLLVFATSRPLWAQRLLPLVADSDPTTAQAAARAVVTCDPTRVPEVSWMLREQG